jgi:hypothetical protein
MVMIAIVMVAMVTVMAMVTMACVRNVLLSHVSDTYVCHVCLSRVFVTCVCNRVTGVCNVSSEQLTSERRAPVGIDIYLVPAMAVGHGNNHLSAATGGFWVWGGDGVVMGW